MNGEWRALKYGNVKHWVLPVNQFWQPICYLFLMKTESDFRYDCTDIPECKRCRKAMEKAGK